jgi:hypothetical protein
MAEEGAKKVAEDKIEFYLAQAAKMIVEAKGASDPAVRKAFFEIARCWLDLAAETEAEDVDAAP